MASQLPALGLPFWDVPSGMNRTWTKSFREGCITVWAWVFGPGDWRFFLMLLKLH